MGHHLKYGDWCDPRVGFGRSPPVQAKTFHCGTGDVLCLITAITEANAFGKKNDIRLKVGTYTLVDAYEKDPTDGEYHGVLCKTPEKVYPKG
jgi:hypothetical protein